MVEITRLVPKEKKGLVVTGHGKGKTTTALGIAVRACGHDMKVSIIQFMKGDLYAGEWDGIKKMNCPVELIATGKGFCGNCEQGIREDFYGGHGKAKVGPYLYIG